VIIRSYKFATIYTQNGDVLAKHVQMQKREVTEVDGIHMVVTALLTKEEASKVSVWTTYLIRIGNRKGDLGSYRLMRREDERLPLRRHTFRSDARS
jgi:hypothetical protein